MLTLTENIHRMSNVDGHLVSILKCHCQFFTTCLSCTVRIGRVISIILTIKNSIRCRTKDFIRTKIHKPFKVVQPTGIVKDVAGCHNIIHDKFHGIFDTTIYMRSSSKVKNIIYLSNISSNKWINCRLQIMEYYFDTSTIFCRKVFQNILKTI